MKVVHSLGRAGYLETTRGKGGGLRLAVPAGDINLGEVVREAEGFTVVPCFDAGGAEPCAIAPVCMLRKVLRGALKAFLDSLDGYTLEDLLQPRRSLRSLLASNLEGRRDTSVSSDAG
jgi:Rrf2 family nitric oxide-sensitive transcriptional repressor